MMALGLGETSGFLRIRVLLLMNLPLEYLSLRISLFLGDKKQGYLVTLPRERRQNVVLNFVFLN